MNEPSEKHSELILRNIATEEAALKVMLDQEFQRNYAIVEVIKKEENKIASFEQEVQKYKELIALRKQELDKVENKRTQIRVSRENLIRNTEYLKKQYELKQILKNERRNEKNALEIRYKNMILTQKEIYNAYPLVAKRNAVEGKYLAALVQLRVVQCKIENVNRQKLRLDEIQCLRLNAIIVKFVQAYKDVQKLVEQRKFVLRQINEKGVTLAELREENQRNSTQITLIDKLDSLTVLRLTNSPRVLSLPTPSKRQLFIPDIKSTDDLFNHFQKISSFKKMYVPTSLPPILTQFLGVKPLNMNSETQNQDKSKTFSETVISSYENTSDLSNSENNEKPASESNTAVRDTSSPALLSTSEFANEVTSNSDASAQQPQTARIACQMQGMHLRHASVSPRSRIPIPTSCSSSRSNVVYSTKIGYPSSDTAPKRQPLIARAGQDTSDKCSPIKLPRTIAQTTKSNQPQKRVNVGSPKRNIKFTKVDNQAVRKNTSNENQVQPRQISGVAPQTTFYQSNNSLLRGLLKEPQFPEVKKNAPQIKFSSRGKSYKRVEYSENRSLLREVPSDQTVQGIDKDAFQCIAASQGQSYVGNLVPNDSLLLELPSDQRFQAEVQNNLSQEKRSNQMKPYQRIDDTENIVSNNPLLREIFDVTRTRPRSATVAEISNDMNLAIIQDNEQADTAQKNTVETYSKYFNGKKQQITAVAKESEHVAVANQQYGSDEYDSTNNESMYPGPIGEHLAHEDEYDEDAISTRSCLSRKNLITMEEGYGGHQFEKTIEYSPPISPAATHPSGSMQCGSINSGDRFGFEDGDITEMFALPANKTNDVQSEGPEDLLPFNFSKTSDQTDKNFNFFF